ncbi:MAG TPA: DEAD/DEAH box helicase [Phycisphaerae bacterium]|nr:DEAD/DEAH box helicase [Phycisphaerae bacterium]
MAKLHGIWVRSNFHIWGEVAAVDGGVVIAPTNGQSDAHPFAVPTDELHAVVGDLSPDGLLASIAHEDSLRLWLPQELGVPVSSQKAATLEEHPETHTGQSLRCFRIPSLRFMPADAIDLLTSLSTPLPDNCGSSVRYWRQLSHFLVEMIRQRQFSPHIDEGANESYTAHWRLTVQSKNSLAWLQEVADAMPHVCRALDGVHERDRDPARLVESFLHICADGLIRRSLVQDPFFDQIHERAEQEGTWDVRWLSSLLGNEGGLDSDAEGRTEFIGHARSWIGKLDRGRTQIPARMCFELLDPAYDDDDLDENVTDAEDKPWKIRYWLQSEDAPNTLQDIAEVWADDSSTPSLLRNTLQARREEIIRNLTRAAEVFAPFEASLQEPQPIGVALNATQAHVFVRDAATLLESRGFGVRLPDWARRFERQIGLRLHVAPVSEQSEASSSSDNVGRSGVGLSSIVDFQWQLAIGDSSISREEFEQLRMQQSPLVRFRGEWVYFDTGASTKAAQFLDAQSTGQMTLGQAIRMAGGATDDDIDLPIFGLDAESWIERLLNAAPNAEFEKLSQPEYFNGTLRPYQLRGLAWLSFMQKAGIGACLADDMGLGKTIQLIALLLQERQKNNAPGPTLIFCPMSVVGNWKRELERFAGELKVSVHHGPERLTGDAFIKNAQKSDAIITTYALGHRDLETLRKVMWHRIVLDEAQKIKNPSAAQTIAIRSLPSTHRIGLTGTPLENHLSELWSIMEMLNPGILGNAAAFRRRFAVPIERLGDSNRAKQLKTMIGPFILRRIKSDPAVECDLPEKMEMRVFCNLTAEQASLYERIVAETMSTVEATTGIRRRGIILASLTRLKQICNHPVHFLDDGSELDSRSGKCERLIDMLEEVISENDRALVFTQFRKMGDLLATLIKKRLRTEAIFLHGGTTSKKREQMVERFQDPSSDVRIFLLSLKAGGLGMNLTAANHVFHFDRWWNPAVEDQATDRAHRIGQTRRVQVHKFVCMGTIEDRIDKMLTEKVSLADRIVGSGDDWITGLSNEDLHAHLMLSREIIAEI